jgi:methylmalonyl-CoA/ethylmalonyl-CoA epimerase
MALPQGKPILQLRVALTAQDYERMVAFYCAGLADEPAQIWSNDGGRALLLDLGKATLEIFDDAQAQAIDRIEVGHRVSGEVRFALEVPDVQAALDRLLAHGGVLVQSPVVTPWGDLNARVQDPAGRQVTLFQASPADDRSDER